MSQNLGRRDGMSRRDLIKGAAAAGAAAWTAPIIAGSIASPAAAASTNCGTYYAAKWDNGWSGTDGVFDGNCELTSTSFNGNALQVPSSFPVFTANATNGNSSLTLPAGCNKFLLVRIHYGNLGEGMTCKDANGVNRSGNVCFDVPLTSTCAATPPSSTTCGCVSGNKVYFPSGGLSNIHAIWCC